MGLLARCLLYAGQRHRISTVFQVYGCQADSLQIGRYTNFLDTTNLTGPCPDVDGALLCG